MAFGRDAVGGEAGEAQKRASLLTVDCGEVDAGCR